MKHLFFLLLIILSINIFAQNNAPNIVDSQGRKQGFWKKYNDKNILLYEGNFVNNVPVGVFKYYHEDGSLKSETDFKEGVHKVFTTIFHPNGKIASEGIFVDQIKDGEWTYWDKDGTLIKTENYSVGKKIGKWTTYSSENGICLEERNYVDGLLHGEVIIYYTNGNVCTIENYISGKRNGEMISYFSDKKISMKGVYHDNLKTDTWEYYNLDGILKKSVEFVKGRSQKIYLHFNNTATSPGIKLNQENIAYFLLEDSQVFLYSKNNQKIPLSDSMESIKQWADIIDFTPVNPNLYAANSSIKGFKEINDEEIIVILNPTLPFEVTSQGNEARAIKALFDTTPIKLEE